MRSWWQARLMCFIIVKPSPFAAQNLQAIVSLPFYTPVASTAKPGCEEQKGNT